MSTYLPNSVENYYGENFKTDESEASNRVAGLLAYHLVNLVLQEGCAIANAAIESGCPREYLSMRKNVRSDLTYVIPAGDNVTNVDTSVDNFIEGADAAKVDSELNLLVTSTPQKTDDQPKRENGQGDEDLEVAQNELSNSTSLFINHLFDISDVELGICDNATILHNADPSELLAPLMSNVMDLYVNAALDAFHASRGKQVEPVQKHVTNPFISAFSYFEEELTNKEKDVSFYVEDYIPSCVENFYEIPQDPMTSQMALQQSGDGDLKEVKIEKSEQYENTYLTLNRDYEQCSDEEEFPVLKDPKGMIMQEIALLTADSSNDTGPVCDKSEEVQKHEKQKGDLAATSGVSASSRKNGLVHKWRLQGARFFACIRGWWRRKAGGKRKESSRQPGSRRGLCPLSPSGRRRAASLLDHRLSSPVPSRLKCNTIDEAILTSSQWMDYTFDLKPNERGDV